MALFSLVCFFFFVVVVVVVFVVVVFVVVVVVVVVIILMPNVAHPLVINFSKMCSFLYLIIKMCLYFIQF